MPGRLPPATNPKANGATTLAAPNSRLSSTWLRVPASTSARNPWAAPRSTIATSAIDSGASSSRRTSHHARCRGRDAVERPGREPRSSCAS